VKENVLEVNRDDLYSVGQECGLSLLVALLKASRPDFSVSAVFTAITCPGMFEPQGKQ